MLLFCSENFLSNLKTCHFVITVTFVTSETPSFEAPTCMQYRHTFKLINENNKQTNKHFFSWLSVLEMASRTGLTSATK